ncbi:Carboxypeptidase regulatory-like domain-containing protein [Balamuthia mandrillaris]
MGGGRAFCLFALLVVAAQGVIGISIPVTEDVIAPLPTLAPADGGRKGDMVPVEVYARSFLPGWGIEDAEVRVLEMPDIVLKTKKGGLTSFMAPVGSNITLVLTKWSYHSVQTSTVTVPPGGLTGKQKQMTLQVPDKLTFFFLQQALPDKLNNKMCHIAATVAAKNKTLFDDEQGEVNSTVSLVPTPSNSPKPFYFGIFMGIFPLSLSRFLSLPLFFPLTTISALQTKR